MSPAELDADARTALTSWASLVGDTQVRAMPGTTNPLWRLDGPGPTLVLKQLPKYPPGVPPVVEFRVLAHLQQHGVPVAIPFLTDHGTLYVTVAERQWMLQPYLPHLSSNHELGPKAAATASAVGAAIGRLDRALAAYPWPIDSYVDDPIKVVTEALPQLPSEATQLVEPFTDLLRRACANLPVQLTHGDCNTGNVLVDRGRVTGIIDVDHLPTGPRVRDLAYYLASRLSILLAEPQAAEVATSAMVAVFSDYVRGYHQAYALTDEERHAIVPLMLITEIGGAHWALNGWETHVARYQQDLQTMTWIADHFDTLVRSAAPTSDWKNPQWESG